MKTMKQYGSAFATSVCLVTMLSACGSSSKKSDLPADTDTSSEISRLETDVKAGYDRDLDVLAPKEFTKSTEALDDAKKSQAKKSSLQGILNSISTSRANLEKADALAAERRTQVSGIADARDGALKAGARSQKDFAAQLKSLDDKFRGVSDHADKVKVADLNELQQGYLSLELKGIQYTKLHDARDLIARARDRGAEKRAQQSLNEAKRSLVNAENVIASNRHNEEAMAPAVTKAQTDAQFVSDVTDTINTHGKIAESVAIEMVRQQQKNAALSNQLNQTQGQLDANQQQLAATSADNAALMRNKKIDEAIERARKEFSTDEAEAYRQGNTLLLRLKKVNFASGRSDLPASALPLLAKVKDVVKDLNSQQITVEGHTDAVGKKATNQKLSTDRAQAVAKYLETENVSGKVEAVGYGSERPLANNKTKAARAQNRRVDVIVTPGDMAGTM